MITNRTPVTRITTSGDPYSLGHTLGVASAEPFRVRVMATTEFQDLQSRWINSTYLEQLELAARSAYPKFVLELEGLADGAELDFQTVFVWNCRGDLRLPEDASPKEQSEASNGCTTLLIPANETKGTPNIIAHNEDGAPEFLGGCFWVTATPDNGTAYESFMYPGMLPGHTVGLNKAGLVQTINNVRVHDLKPGIPRQIISRALLDCKNLGEAVRVLERKDRASGFHHNLGCAGDKRLLSVEAPASGCDVKNIINPSTHANHLIAEQFQNVDQEITHSSDARQSKSDELISQPGSDLSNPEEILFDRSEEARVLFRDNDSGDDYGATLATTVFKISETCVEWTLHGSTEETKILSGRIDL